MAALRFGGHHSPGAEADAPPPAFRNRRVRRVSLRARLMYLLPTPLFFAGLGAAFRGQGFEMAAEWGGLITLLFSAHLLNSGLQAEQAYEARAVAKPPVIPRKLFAAALAGLGVLAPGLAAGPGFDGGIVFALVAAIAQLVAFGLDPMRRKIPEGSDGFAAERAARSIEAAEELLAGIDAAAGRIGDRALRNRIEQLCARARDVFRRVEQDPRDLARARSFLGVYLLGLRDATEKFAEIWNRSRDPEARARYEGLLADLEESFAAHRRDLLEDDRGALEIEIDVLRERLQQDGLITR